MINMPEQFNYPILVDEAMRGVVRQVMVRVDEEGLEGDHHFYISFNTRYPGVKLSPQLMEQYPEEMTIVMQHQFWDLVVKKQFFSLMLSFNNIPEKLVIPYDALTAFADPSVKFGLQFHEKPLDDEEEDFASELLSEPSFEEDVQSGDAEKSDENTVVSLDAFRKS